MSRLQTQVCIVGAGPAGCTLALFFAKYKIPHILVEKESFPRDKVCGDGLTLEVMHTLSQVAPNALDALLGGEAFHPCWSAHFQGPSGHRVALQFSPEIHPYAPLYTGSRKDFDLLLWDHLDPQYTRALSATKVVDIRHSQGRCVLRLGANTKGIQEIIASIVIGADGSSSIVRRPPQRENPDVRASARGVGIRAYGHIQEIAAPKEAMEFLFYKNSFPDIFWVFPMTQNKVNVGIYIPAKLLKKKRIKLGELLQQCTARYNKSLPRRQQISTLTAPQTWGLPLRIHSRSLGGENYLLLGDAGSLIEPFTGKGIGLAMLSAKVAAQILATGIVNHSHFPQLHLQYRDAMKRMYSREYLVSNLLHKTFSSSVGANAVLWLLSRKSIQPYWQHYLQKEIVKWQH